MSVTFPCYCRVLDAFKPEKKDQMPLKKGEFVRVLRADETGFGQRERKKKKIFFFFFLFCLFLSSVSLVLKIHVGMSWRNMCSNFFCFCCCCLFVLFCFFLIFFFFFLDDNYFGEVFGKSGFFPNYYVEVVTEEDVPKKDRELFKKLDKTKEAVAAKEKEKEEKLLQKSPVPRLSRNNVDAVRNNDVSPRRSQAERKIFLWCWC